MGVYGQAGTPITGSPPSCRVYNSATQSAPDAGGLTVLYNSEYHDPAGMHSTSANTERITITDSGVYVATFTFQLTARGDYLFIQGAVVSNALGNLGFHLCPPPPAAYEPWFSVTTPPVKLTAGDFLTTTIFQDNSANVAATVKATTCTFGAQWLGLGT